MQRRIDQEELTEKLQDEVNTNYQIAARERVISRSKSKSRDGSAVRSKSRDARLGSSNGKQFNIGRVTGNSAKRDRSPNAYQRGNQRLHSSQDMSEQIVESSHFESEVEGGELSQPAESNRKDRLNKLLNDIDTYLD